MKLSNKIHISLDTKSIKTAPLHRWDTGQVLHFDDVEIPLNTTCQFDFGDETINQLVDTDTNEVDIPNSLLGEDFNGDIRAHLYMTDTDYGMTVYDILIPVFARPQPADHVSPDNTQTIEEWITEQVQTIDADREAVEATSATASVDANVGTPSVTVTKTTIDDHINLDFAFSNIKGAKGDTGAKGDSIGTVSASVDANTGTPSVVVTQSGGSGSPIDVSLAFSNLKGENGANGADGKDGKDGKDGADGKDGKDGVDGTDGDSIGTVSATVDANVGTPSVDVTQTGGSGSPINVSLAFHNLKGTFDTSYLPSDHVSGSPATFPDGAKDVPVDSLVVDINPIQTGSGTPSPSNPRTISGHSSVSITINGDTDSIALGQTVYGGSLNVTTGVLTIDKVYAEFDGSENWVNVGGGYPQAFQLDTGINNARQIQDGVTIWGESNLFIWIAVSSADDNGIRWQYVTDESTVGRGRIYCYDATHSSNLAGFTQMLHDTHLQICYRVLAKDEITVQLTPTEVQTILGSNSMGADSGDVTVYYRADIGLYIDKKTS